MDRIDFKGEYQKTFFAMRALTSAVKEEAKDEEELAVLSATAVGGSAMAVARLINGKSAMSDGKERLSSKDYEVAIRVLEACLEFTRASWDDAEREHRRNHGKN